MKNLVIGGDSQLAYYFPDNYIKISSRDIDYSLYDDFYDRIFICFAEQRTFIEKSRSFEDINVDYTIDVLSNFNDKCNKLVIYGTCELWNEYHGPINLNMRFNHNHSDYTNSKHKLVNVVKNLGINAVILHPFNFNSPYRKEGFLFNKIFDSIINEKEIEIGDTYFYRDLIHPKYVVERSILAEEDELVGSGRLTHLNDFIRNLYSYFNLDYTKLVKEDLVFTKKTEYYLESKELMYSTLFEDTVNDIIKFKK